MTNRSREKMNTERNITHGELKGEENVFFLLHKRNEYIKFNLVSENDFMLGLRKRQVNKIKFNTWTTIFFL